MDQRAGHAEAETDADAVVRANDGNANEDSESGGDDDATTMTTTLQRGRPRSECRQEVSNVTVSPMNRECAHTQ